jgi:hypothetical protein
MNWIFPHLGRPLVSILLVGSFLTGCSTPATPTPAPTQDPATLIAAAVETLEVQMTDEAIRNPSATPEPTATPVTPTATPIPNTPTPTIVPTITNTPVPPLSAQFNYATTYPENKREYIPNEEFGLALGFENTGTITWLPGYRLKIVNYVGEVTVQQEVELGQAIEPGKKVEFNLWAFGSETLGQHVWYFQLYTPEGVPVPGGVGVYSYTSQ